jgi:haloalkane dehalogenase
VILVTVEDVLEAHRRAGRPFSADGIASFVREQGSGPAVVCMHGMWGSSFGFAHLLDQLAGRGVRGVAWDLPGFGLADRPRDYDYSWTGLGRFAVAAVDALGLDRFHLVVHDIGGPVGFELAWARPHQVASLTILNTMIDVSGFRPPWPMRPFRRRGIGEIWLAGLTRPAVRHLLRRQGIHDTSKVSDAELDAYLTLMKGDDRARAFLTAMRSTEPTPDKQTRYRAAAGSDRYPVQVIWGYHDPALPLHTHGEQARAAAGVPAIHALPAKHFLQHDQAPAIADLITHLARNNSNPAA